MGFQLCLLRSSLILLHSSVLAQFLPNTLHATVLLGYCALNFSYRHAQWSLEWSRSVMSQFIYKSIVFWGKDYSLFQTSTFFQPHNMKHAAGSCGPVLFCYLNYQRAKHTERTKFPDWLPDHNGSSTVRVKNDQTLVHQAQLPVLPAEWFCPSIYWDSQWQTHVRNLYQLTLYNIVYII